MTGHPTTDIGFRPRTVLELSAAGLTDIGKARTLNEDAYLLRPNLCLWAVADGMGGHDGGDFASRTVVEHLEQVRMIDDPRALLDDVLERLQAANAALLAEAGRRGGSGR